MVVRIVRQEKNLIEVDFGDVDLSIPGLVVERLNASGGVEFAACKVEHPIASTPHVIVKAKKGDPAKLLLETLESIKKDVDDFRKQFAGISK